MDRKKQLKLEYKETPRPMGVFKIKNTANGKFFIDSSMNIPGSFNGQRFQLNLQSHRNRDLQEDWNSYGADAFVFEILETIKPEKFAKEDWRKAVAALKDKWLENLQPYKEKGYNKQKS
ncbi:hypothetical protein SDC9_13826 [bioreactor metagenome]|uniref:GIY-YIG domain-containing protein n=1 Tax=bioreactor metagenome TaxID=1076179 RepID=A0A644TMF1_9ZZZZ|nr:GIY-YIG nuclease family protein [Negativicutes bacterium]